MSAHSATLLSRSPRRQPAWTALLLAMALTLGLVGCRRSEAPVGDSAAIRISQLNEPSDLDPATASLPDEFFIIRALGEGLLAPNPSGGPPLPAVAESYALSVDGLTYTFRLRANAQWSNGEALTADDFIASYRRVLTPATAAPKADLFFSVKNARAFTRGEIADFSAVGFRAPDPQTLVVTLERPTPEFPRYVASGPWIPVNPRIIAAHGKNWTQPAFHVGNGPFTLTEWKPQQRIIVRRNPRYPNAADLAPELHFVRFDGPSGEERAFRAGQVHVTLTVPQSKLEIYARQRPEELHRAPLAETRFLSFNVSRRPFNDPRVRLALSLALDRQTLVTRVLRGSQTPAFRFLSPELRSDSTTEPAAELNEHRHDPVLARRLLAEAGYPEGSGFPAFELSGWSANPVLEAIQQMWTRELGIQTRISVREAKVHLNALHSGSYDVAFVTNLLDVPDATAALASFTTNAPNNFPHWRHAEFDALIATAAQESGPAGTAARRRAEALLLRDAAIAPIYFNAQNWLMSREVIGWQQDALWTRRYHALRLTPRAPVSPLEADQREQGRPSRP